LELRDGLSLLAGTNENFLRVGIGDDV